MVTQAENETLVRVGPGTDMGEYMRRYWHPVATSAQLPEPDCKPLRIKLPRQKLVVFRNSEGEVGVSNELCMHRGASLAVGRVAEGGIRFLYHCWKFAVSGTLLAPPTPPDCRYRGRLQTPA